MRKIAVYPGTFDPVTNGHVDIITRALQLFSSVIVMVHSNPPKETLFDADERISLVNKSLKNIRNVSVMGFTGLTVEFARKVKASVLVRGLRAVSDFEFEMQMGLMNRKLNKNIQTIYLMPKENYIYLSSSMVKEIARFNGDITDMVSSSVQNALRLKLEQTK
ncbi:MAG: pantetheine-phosphate adenylyltransferase [bacterium]